MLNIKQKTTLPAKSTYTDRGFQSRLVALALREPKFVEHHIEILKPIYFDSAPHAHIIQVLNDFVIKYQKLPSLDTIKSKINSYIDTNNLSDIHKDVILSSLDEAISLDLEDAYWVKDEAIAFAQRQEMRSAILDSRELLDDPESHHQILQRIQKALNVGAPRGLGLSFKESAKDLPARIRNNSLFDSKKRVPTGVASLDKVMMGGIGPGEIGVILGPSGKGKSQTLSSFSVNALLNNFTVFYFSLELKEEDVMLRYAANIAGIPMDDIVSGEHDDDYLEKIMPILSKLDGDSYIKYFPPKSIKASGLRSHISYVIQTLGFKPNLIVVDYADKLDTGSKGFSSSENSAAIGIMYDELIAIGADFECGIWTASQVGKESWEDDVIKKGKVASSVEKINNADIAITLNQNDEEAHLNKIRLSLEKNRRGKDGHICYCILEKDIARLTSDPDANESRIEQTSKSVKKKSVINRELLLRKGYQELASAQPKESD